MKEDEKLEDAEEEQESDLEEGEEEGEEGEGNSKAKAKAAKKKKLIIIVGALAGVVIIVLGVLFSGILGGGDADGEGESHSAEEVDPALAPQRTYFDLSEFLVNLNNPGRQVSFLKITVTLELPNMHTKGEVESNLPRIRDSFQVYLRELRSSDLQGSAGLHRLREELVLRVNKVIAPESVSDVLFKEIIVQ